MEEHLRIRYKHDVTAADRDKRIFSSWEKGDITTATATKWLSNNNQVNVSEEQFLANAKMLGYIRRNKYDEATEKWIDESDDAYYSIAKAVKKNV